MNLRDAHLSRDSVLAHPLEEGEVQEPPFALVEGAEALGQDRSVLSRLVPVFRRPLTSRAGPSPFPFASGESETGSCDRTAARASSASSRSTPASRAISATVAGRSSVADKPAALARSEAFTSWRRRGIRIGHTRSRRCLLISPTMLGIAYAERSTPRSSSNRSIALIRPIEPTWTRSSKRSPRPACWRRVASRAAGTAGSALASLEISVPVVLVEQGTRSHRARSARAARRKAVAGRDRVSVPDGQAEPAARATYPSWVLP